MEGEKNLVPFVIHDLFVYPIFSGEEVVVNKLRCVYLSRFVFGVVTTRRSNRGTTRATRTNRINDPKGRT